MIWGRRHSTSASLSITVPFYRIAPGRALLCLWRIESLAWQGVRSRVAHLKWVGFHYYRVTSYSYIRGDHDKLRLLCLIAALCRRAPAQHIATPFARGREFARSPPLRPDSKAATLRSRGRSQPVLPTLPSLPFFLPSVPYGPAYLSTADS